MKKLMRSFAAKSPNGFLRHNKAFSFIELIVVIIVFSIIALTAAVKFGPYDAMKVDAAARKIASDITYAQMLAMTNAYNCTSILLLVIDFDTASQTPSNRYRMFSRGTTMTPVTDPFSKESFIVDFNAGTYQGVRIESAVFVGPAGCSVSPCCNSPSCDNIGFTPYRGQPQACRYSSGAYPPKGELISDGKIEISYRNKKRQIRVTKETGRAYVVICPDGGACPP